MATLHARNFPERTYGELRRLAAERHTSIGEEAIRLIRRALRTDRPETRELLEQIETTRPFVRRRGVDGARLVRADRDGHQG